MELEEKQKVKILKSYPDTPEEVGLIGTILQIAGSSGKRFYYVHCEEGENWYPANWLTATLT